jgi:hypothetical protein
VPRYVSNVIGTCGLVAAAAKTSVIVRNERSERE